MGSRKTVENGSHWSLPFLHRAEAGVLTGGSFAQNLFCAPVSLRIDKTRPFLFFSSRKAAAGWAKAAGALLLLGDNVHGAGNERAPAVHGRGRNGVWEIDQASALRGDSAPVYLCPPSVRDPAALSPNRQGRVQ